MVCVVLMFKVTYNIIIFIVPCVRIQPLNYKTIVPNFIREVIILIHRKTTRILPVQPSEISHESPFLIGCVKEGRQLLSDRRLRGSEAVDVSDALGASMAVAGGVRAASHLALRYH